MRIDEPQLRNLIAGAGNRIGIWKQILRAAQVKTVAEIGVRKGRFSSKILATCEAIERYYMTDPWAELPDWNKPGNFVNKEFDDIYREAMAATEFAQEKITVLRGITKDVIDQIPDQSLDFAYIDGDHTLRGLTIDLTRVLPKMKPGGIIGGDDFSQDPWHHGIGFEPTLVCPFSIYFAEANKIPFFALPFSQFLMQNQLEAGFSFTDIAGNYNNIPLNELLASPSLRLRRKELRGAGRAADPLQE